MELNSLQAVGSCCTPPSNKLRVQASHTRRWYCNGLTPARTHRGGGPDRVVPDGVEASCIQAGEARASSMPPPTPASWRRTRPEIPERPRSQPEDRGSEDEAHPVGPVQGQMSRGAHLPPTSSWWRAPHSPRPAPTVSHSPEPGAGPGRGQRCTLPPRRSARPRPRPGTLQ